MDDDEGRNYSLYYYDKLFGLKHPSKKDAERVGAGEESIVDRTRRLFYVCCSRARRISSSPTSRKTPNSLLRRSANRDCSRLIRLGRLMPADSVPLSGRALTARCPLLGQLISRRRRSIEFSKAWDSHQHSQARTA